jgi:hypothetical protein
MSIPEIMLCVMISDDNTFSPQAIGFAPGKSRFVPESFKFPRQSGSPQPRRNRFPRFSQCIRKPNVVCPPSP